MADTIVASTGTGSKPIGARSVLLRCSDCKREQLVHLGSGFDGKAEADSFLCLMTGGHFGATPFPFKKTEPGDGSIIGRSECCVAQLEGEVIDHTVKA